MTRNEQIASIMLEAADLLNESGGKMGRIRAGQSYARDINADYYGEDSKIVKRFDKALKKQNDRYDANTQKINDLKKRYKDASPAGKAVIERQIQKAVQQNRAVKNTPDYAQKGDTSIRGALKFVKDQKPSRDEVRRNILKESIDILYDRAIYADTIDEATEYIEKAEVLESLMD